MGVTNNRDSSKAGIILLIFRKKNYADELPQNRPA